MIKQIKNTVPWTYVSNLKGKTLLEHFTKNNCKKKNQKEFRFDKTIKRKGDKLHVKWRGYNIHLIAELIKNT